MSLGSLPTFLLLPPANLVAGAVVGLVAGRRWPRLGRVVVVLSVVGLALLGMPAVANLLMGSLQAGIPRAVPPPEGAGAIVVLSAETSRGEGGILPEPGIGMMTLERLHAGVVLARRTGLPLLVSGGSVENEPGDIASRMDAVLRADYALPARWVEGRSIDTWQNARFSAEALRADNIRRVYVVTNAWHMRRSLLAFRKAGLEPIPAASRFDREGVHDAGEFIPRVSGWLRSYWAIHEWIGLAWYGLHD